MAIAAIITIVVVNVNNAPVLSAAGPKNMATGAIQFTGRTARSPP
ncbi:hypothetical protein [Curtobacterium poinsettiae]|nr:hypothetical protein [Curtobacterium flaccumfaciens]MCU0115122.1 hypothetical protein [Curtobacterium flaccumfaciens]